MSFYVYDIVFLVLFSLFVGIFLWKTRKKLKREGLMYLYRTKVGIRFINYVGTKYKKTLSILAFFVVITGYLLMAVMLYFFWRIVYVYLFVPSLVKQIKIPPIMPLFPYIPKAFNLSFLPPFYFTYWILSIAVIAIFHEFAHGIFARRYNVKILTTGFGFLGPFLAAFVEPDEKEMAKKKKFEQIAILSAGTFVNLILGILFFLLLSVFFVLAYQPAGALFNSYTPGVINVSSIKNIGGIGLNDSSKEEFFKVLNNSAIEIITINNISFTKLIAKNKTYFATLEGKLSLKQQLSSENEMIVVYEDLPAIRNGLEGIIIDVDGIPIKTYKDLSNILKEKKPGDNITITTRILQGKNETLKKYEFTLAKDPRNESRAVIGIAFFNYKPKLIGELSDFFLFFKQPATFYEPAFNGDLILFIYNLIWWLAIINLSVALVNMLPLGLFDGGRVFLLTVWAITKNEKLAKKTYVFVTYVFLIILALITINWFKVIF